MSDTAKIWFVHDGVAKAGPITLAELQARFERGEVALSHYLWREGMPTWKMASELDVLKPVAVSEPPLFEPGLEPVPMNSGLGGFEKVSERPVENPGARFETQLEPRHQGLNRSPSQPNLQAARIPQRAALGRGSPAHPVEHDPSRMTHESAQPSPMAVAPVLSPAHGSRTGDDLSALIEIPVKDAADTTGLLDVGQLRNARREAAKAAKVSQDQQKISPTPQFHRSPEEGIGFMPRLGICLGAIAVAALVSWWMMPSSYVGSASSMIQKAFSPIPTLKDVSPEEYAALSSVANSGIEQGVRADFALSQGAPEAPSFYVATNQPKGTQLVLMIDPVLGTLVGDAPGTLQVTINVVDKLGKTDAIHTKDGSNLPMGDYKIDLKDKDGRVLTSHPYFLGGSRDSTYTAKLGDYLNARRTRAMAEITLFKTVIDKIDALAALDRQTVPTIMKQPAAAREQAWGGYDAQFTAKLAEIEHDLSAPATVFTKLQRSIQDARGSTIAVHAGHKTRLTLGTPQRNVASGGAPDMVQLSAVLVRDIADARERADGAVKSAGAPGFVKEE